MACWRSIISDKVGDIVGKASAWQIRERSCKADMLGVLNASKHRVVNVLILESDALTLHTFKF